MVLTEVVEDINDKGKARIDNALAKKPNSKGLDSYGYSLEKWEDMGIPIPEDSIHFGKSSDNEENEIQDGFITLTDEELEYVYFDTIFPQKEFIRAVDLDDFGSLVYLKNGGIIRVEEDTDDIYAQYQMLNETTFDKVKKWLKEKFRNKKNDLIL